MWLKYWSPPPAWSVYIFQPLLFKPLFLFFFFIYSGQAFRFLLYLILTLLLYLLSPLPLPDAALCPFTLPHIPSVNAVFHCLNNLPLYYAPLLSLPSIISILFLGADCFILSVSVSLSPPPFLLSLPAHLLPPLFPLLSLLVAFSLAVCLFFHEIKVL